MSRSGDSLQLDSVATLDELVGALRIYCRIALESVHRAQDAMVFARQMAEERFEEARSAYERAIYDDDDGYSYEAEVERDAADRSLSEISASVEAMRRQTAELEELCDSHSPRWLRALDNLASNYSAYARLQYSSGGAAGAGGLSFREIVVETAGNAGTIAHAAANSSTDSGSKDPSGAYLATWDGVSAEDLEQLANSRAADAMAVGKALLESGVLSTLNPRKWARRNGRGKEWGQKAALLNYLQEIEIVSAGAVGRPACTIKYGTDMDDAAGEYHWGEYEIAINWMDFAPARVSTDDPRDTLRHAFDTIIQEGRHGHQDAMTRQPPEITLYESSALPPAIRSRFLGNVDNYVRTAGVAYYAQPLEYDAWAFEAAVQRDPGQDHFLSLHPELANMPSANVFDLAVPITEEDND